ncbi:E3 ubiquitin-protein ligase ZNRF4-like [Sphaerodactylus townsendi]|uniref:E3 ubiquitin-protein ligase ZNRF4-like n=1 Tax=Sphaerodactylus townsendi TaxID=933632 RepID=UPI0020274A1C|nr:E3 ubiquitin-protein ligase ZNRF4-like [Sphaerodactylus townsendi]
MVRATAQKPTVLSDEKMQVVSALQDAQVRPRHSSELSVPPSHLEKIISIMRFLLQSHLSLFIFPMLLEAVLGKPFVHLVLSHNSTCFDSQAVPACFGPPLAHVGLRGYLFEAVPANACLPIKAPPVSKSSPRSSIVLIRRYDCPFSIKVLHAQEAGYQGAIIHNLHSDVLVSMSVEVEKTRMQILIPSLFIGESASKLLRKAVHSQNETEVKVVMPRGYYNPCWDNMGLSVWDPARHHLQYWPGHCTQQVIVKFLQEFGLVILLSMGISFLVVASCVKWCWRNRRIKVQTFKRGDKYDLCVICMAEYEAGDRLKVLPCSHVYHNTCIDTWLLLQPQAGKICPICKQHVDTAA